MLFRSIACRGKLDMSFHAALMLSLYPPVSHCSKIHPSFWAEAIAPVHAAVLSAKVSVGVDLVKPLMDSSQRCCHSGLEISLSDCIGFREAARRVLLHTASSPLRVIERAVERVVNPQGTPAMMKSRVQGTDGGSV